MRNMYVKILLVVMLFFVKPVYANSLEKAQKAYLTGDYTMSLSLLGQIPQDNVDANVLYFLGLNQFKLLKYQKSRDTFAALIEKYPKSSWVDVARLKIADSYFLEGDIATAHDLFLEMEQKENFEHKPFVYLRLAQINAKYGNWEAKKEYLDIIKNQFPDAVEQIMVKRLESMEDFFTVQVGAFSKRSNAYRLERKLKKYDSYVVVDKEKNFTLYKVRVGKLETRKDVENLYDTLVEKGYSARIYP